MSEVIVSMGMTLFFGPRNCANECIVSNLALLNWAELPLLSVVFRAILICFSGGCLGFFSPGEDQ